MSNNKDINQIEGKKVEDIFSGSGVVFENNFYERDFDGVAFDAANPDDTILFFGPPRYQTAQNNQATSDSYFKIIGFAQGVSIQSFSSVMMNPTMGTGLKFATKAGENINMNINRLIFSGTNVLAEAIDTIIKGAYQGKGGTTGNHSKNELKNRLNETNDIYQSPISQGDLKDGSPSKVTFGVGLGSEIFTIPIGIGLLSRNKEKKSIGGLYLETALIQGYQLGIFAGQPNAMETVQIVADRLISISHNDTANASSDFWEKIRTVWLKK